MKELVCIVCPKGCHLLVDDENGYTVTGNDCPRGEAYGVKELTDPTRVITSTVKIEGGLYRRLPVKTDRDIPKAKIFDAMAEIDKVTAASPVKRGDVLIADLLGTGANVIAAKDM